MFSKSLPPISYGLSRKVDTWWLAPSLYGLSVVVIAVLVVVNGARCERNSGRRALTVAIPSWSDHLRRNYHDYRQFQRDPNTLVPSLYGRTAEAREPVFTLQSHSWAAIYDNHQPPHLQFADHRGG